MPRFPIQHDAYVLQNAHGITSSSYTKPGCEDDSDCENAPMCQNLSCLAAPVTRERTMAFRPTTIVRMEERVNDLIRGFSGFVESFEESGRFSGPASISIAGVWSDFGLTVRVLRLYETMLSSKAYMPQCRGGCIEWVGVARQITMHLRTVTPKASNIMRYT